MLQLAGLTAADVKQLDSTGRLVSQISIRSPITGRVIERMAVSGTHVDPMSPLYRVANLDELWLEINIPQDYIDDIKIGDKVQVENTLVEAEIKVLGQSVNPENQTILSRAVIRDKGGFKISPVTILGKQSDGSVVTGNFSGNEEIAMNNAVALKANWLGLGSGE